MKRLLAVLFAVAVALPVAADTQVVCSITPQAETACSAITVSQAGQLDQCRCNQNAPAPAGPFGGHATLADGLVSYWPLDEESGVRADLVGSNDLTDNNTVGFASVTGPPNFPAGKAASFVAANSEYLSRTNFTFGSGSYTYAVWAYSSSPSTYQSFGSVGTGAWAGITSELGGLITAGTLYNQIGYDGGSLSNYSTKAAPSNDAWHLIMTTYDADTNIIQVYVDDVAGTAFSPADNRYNDAASVLRIGSLQNLLASYWNGQLSNAAVWSRVLTSQERTDLYNSGAGLFYEN